MAGASVAAPAEPVASVVDKADAVIHLAARAGLHGLDPRGPGVADSIAAIARVLGRLSNPHVELSDVATIGWDQARLVFPEQARTLMPPLHLSGMPDCFTTRSPRAESPAFRVMALEDWFFCHYPDSSLVVSPSGDMVARGVSSRFAGLVHYYETSLRRMLANAARIDGTVVVLGDDVRPLNYCHWLVDWLPRLAALGEQTGRDDMFVVVPPLPDEYQWATLRLAGFPRERVIELGPMQALRARRLLVSNDLAAIPHPGHKAAPWVLHYLRGTIGYGAFLTGMNGPTRRKKLYVSRADATGRRVVNEAALFAALAPFGYERVTLAGKSAEQQIATFAGASHIVAPHGAGLANIVFADRSATLLELFPFSYGTAAYYVLAAGLGMTYASFITDQIVPGSRSQLDDMVIDIDDFLARCGEML